MMKKLAIFFTSLSSVVFVACSPVTVAIKNQYQLNAYSTKQFAKKPLPITLMVTTPDVAAGYQTEQMLYIKKPFELESFAKNAWVNPPAEMLYPLIVQSLQQTNLFKAVTSNAYALGADYRLDTQLLSLDQNFLMKPSVLEFSAKVVLTRVSDNKILASHIYNFKTQCPSDTPYGGVIAANRAMKQFTASLAHFVASHIRA